ncbi:hypothetical protein [Legionella rowbothamii]|uniref:hypothetical protein n=1 Tax=Legionella rowbothamii TaxID=96229 RepID=UPI0010567DB5|nr:hypothetical protein [Legionella rowbothamii]
MHLVINSECSSIPEGVKPLSSEGTALLNLLCCLGYDPADPPFGDLLRKVHQLDGDWLIVSPVYWQASHNDALILAAGKGLELQESETKLWFELFANYFVEEDITLHYHDAETWLLQDHKKRVLKAKPVYQLVNKSLMPELAQLDKSLFWQRFVTESQMLFASKPNSFAANGLWPWGNAKLKEPKTTAICADAAFFPLAKQCSTNVILYSPEVNLKEYEIVLISEYSTLSQSHQEELTKRSVQWYWNNAAYSSYSDNWFTRLWRKLIHAN